MKTVSEIDRSKLRADMRRHRNRPGESARIYRERSLARFRSRLSGRKAVYLDTNYWIDLQKAAAGVPKRMAFSTLWDQLRVKVEAGVIFCPVSAGLLAELAKQTDRETRLATARIMDALCSGAGLTPEDDLIVRELTHLLLDVQGQEVHDTVAKPPWLPVGCVAAGVEPPPFPFPLTPQKRQQQEKATFDQLLALRVDEVADLEFPNRGTIWTDLARRLTEEAAAHQDELLTFQDALAAEAMGAARASREAIAAALECLKQELGIPPEFPLMGPRWVQLVGAALVQSQAARTAAPSLYVRAGLYALQRWNKRQKVKPGDVFDFGHAAAALGYCDLFLTEGPLKDMLGRGPLRLEAANACRVVADPEAAIEAIAAL
jgi:hypothetical protein